MIEDIFFSYDFRLIRLMKEVFLWILEFKSKAVVSIFIRHVSVEALPIIGNLVGKHVSALVQRFSERTVLFSMRGKKARRSLLAVYRSDRH